MGFFDKMKAANGMNLGNVESPDFPCCSIVPKNGVPTIIGAAMNSKVSNYPIYNSKVEEFYILAGGGNWVKYYIKFTDGKSAVITQTMPTQGSVVSMASIERFISIKMPKSNNSSVPVAQTPAFKNDTEEVVDQAQTTSDSVDEDVKTEDVTPVEEKVVVPPKDYALFMADYASKDADGHFVHIVRGTKAEIISINDDNTCTVVFNGSTVIVSKYSIKIIKE